MLIAKLNFFLSKVVQYEISTFKTLKLFFLLFAFYFTCIFWCIEILDVYIIKSTLILLYGFFFWLKRTSLLKYQLYI